MLGFAERLSRFFDVERVRDAIATAERRTSGELRVSVSPFFWGDVHRAAERAFVRLGMKRTRHRNGVLFFVVPSRRAFVVLGDTGIHERVGQGFWDGVVRRMSPYFAKQDFTSGVVAGIEAAAAALAEHFPPDTANENELSDDIDTGHA